MSKTTPELVLEAFDTLFNNRDYVAAARASVQNLHRSSATSVVMAARIKGACHLLAGSETPLAEIAYLSGFMDQSHFSRVFGYVHGTSPGVLRREHTGISIHSTHSARDD